jgi:hypothetical protein
VKVSSWENDYFLGADECGKVETVFLGGNLVLKTFQKPLKSGIL